MSPPLSFSELALSACAGGAVSSVVTTPLDVIRVRTQATGRVSGGMATQFAVVIRMEGVAALWSGLRPALGTVVPATAIYMSLYDTLKERLSSPLLAGGLARLVSLTATSPLELMRTRAQAFPSVGGGSNAFTLDHVGPLRLWRGTSASIARDVPFSCLYWALFERLKACIAARHYAGHGTAPKPSLRPDTSMVVAAAAAAVAAVPTTPMDVIKTRMQVLDAAAPTTSVSSVGHGLYRSGGVRNLFLGVLPRVSKVAPSCAIVMGVYETCKAQCERWRGREHGVRDAV
uniref:Mitochondrial carrier protein n=1 Tax=Emiliania huxleyi TaxID=2903 RepID=A0A6V2WS27_EMIHU|mmetsp:Transcript_27392/g.82057  ORF Transcript_27392/g.82057 Transcript_27392/m.82057 type:complete len:288 (-) Transcript_27392:218-1081(-)